jgi:Domain of unknown function (DUF4136)
MRQTRISLSVLVIALLTSSMMSAQEVQTNYMPGTDFAKYHTYKWVSIQNGAHPNQIVNQEIVQAIDSQLATKGLTKTDSDQADLYVGYQVAVNQQKQWTAFGTGGGWGWGGGMATATSSTIDNGTLVLDMYDPATKKLIWTGRATKTLNPSGNPEKNQKNIDKAMDKLLKHFPPEGK